MARLEAAVALWITGLAVTFLVSAVNTQRGTVLPAAEFTFGSFTSGATICYANSAITHGHRVAPARRTFTFIPTAAQMNVRFIEITSTDGQKIYAQIINGGIGTANPNSLDILVIAAHNTNLSVQVRVFCGA